MQAVGPGFTTAAVCMKGLEGEGEIVEQWRALSWDLLDPDFCPVSQISTVARSLTLVFTIETGKWGRKQESRTIS